MFFSLGRVVLYIAFMGFPSPKTLVKTLAKNLVNKRRQTSGKKCGRKFVRQVDRQMFEKTCIGGILGSFYKEKWR